MSQLAALIVAMGTCSIAPCLSRLSFHVIHVTKPSDTSILGMLIDAQGKDSVIPTMAISVSCEKVGIPENVMTVVQARFAAQDTLCLGTFDNSRRA